MNWIHSIARLRKLKAEKSDWNYKCLNNQKTAGKMPFKWLNEYIDWIEHICCE